MSTRSQNVVKKQTRVSGSKTNEKTKKEDSKVKEDLNKLLLKKENTKLMNRKTTKTIDKNSSSTKSTSSRSSTSNLPSKMKITSTNSRKAPSTPPSSRVSKTQFFPSKDMYSNALKRQETSDKKPTTKQTPETIKQRERNKTRTLSPSEIKILKTETKPSTSNIKRPGTATIRKAEPETHSDEYEDDFESYESDFEEYLSSPDDVEDSSTSSEDTDTSYTKKTKIENEEERKLDSGNFELPEYKHKQVLSNIIESIEQENALLQRNFENNRSNLTSLSDEGFDESKSDKTNFVNFLDAQKKHNQIKSAKGKRKRGEELMTMIRLDNQNFTLFEMSPIPYDVFIIRYGNNNAIQTSSQTGDDYTDEEIQTSAIDVRNIWTQCPTKFSRQSFTGNNLNLYKTEYLGSGSDKVDEFSLKYVENNLKDFLEKTSNVMLTLLEEKQQQTHCKDIENNKKSIPFSDGYVTFNTNLEFIKDKTTNFVTFSENTTKLLTVHNSIHDRSLICLWKISDQNYPEDTFSIFGNITCCSLHNSSLFGGLIDGTIAIWDLNKNESNENEHKPPSYLTDIQIGHNSKIIAVETIQNIDDDRNLQLYTLDDEGLFIIWISVPLRKHHKTEFNLHINAKISLKEQYRHFIDLECTDMSVSKLDATHIFITTNYGHVLHFVTTGKKPHPKFYINESTTASNCIVQSPFSPLYFLSGYQNGNVILFSRNLEKPLMVMSNSETNECQTHFIEWSRNKPCVFYTKDSNNKINVWDLTQSDIYPIYSIGFKENINFIKLSPGISQDNSIKRSYMVIVMDNNEINLHILNKDHGQQDQTNYEDNIKKFVNYVNRL